MPPDMLQKWTAQFAIECEKRNEADSGPSTKRKKLSSGVPVPTTGSRAIGTASAGSPPRFHKVPGECFCIFFDLIYLLTSVYSLRCFRIRRRRGCYSSSSFSNSLSLLISSRISWWYNFAFSDRPTYPYPSSEGSNSLSIAARWYKVPVPRR